MPEGDTIHRAAAMLRAALEGAVVTGFEAPRATGNRARRRSPASASSRVEARGKHLLIRFGGGTTLHTHMRMTGVVAYRSRRRSETCERWPDRRHRPDGARGGACASAAPVVELLDDHALRRHPVLAALGPDLCLPDPDLDEIVRRVGPARTGHGDRRGAPGPARRRRDRQRLQVGGGVRVPRGPVHPARRPRSATTGSRCGGPRASSCDATSGPARAGPTPHGLAVYDRAGRPCRVCGTAIAVRRQGEDGRSTWWCPTCQSRWPTHGLHLRRPR